MISKTAILELLGALADALVEGCEIAGEPEAAAQLALGAVLLRDRLASSSAMDQAAREEILHQLEPFSA